MSKARLAALVLLAACSVAQAQAPTQTSRPTPQRTTASYDDWVVRCEIHGAAKVCEMAQAMVIQGQSQPIAQIAIGQQNKTEPMKVVFQLPIGVWLPAGARLATKDGDVGVAAVYVRCQPAVCIAQADISDDQIKKLRGMTDSGKLQFKDAAQHDVVVPVSFKGFAQAYDAMQQQS
jgi:invasion protein IalB